MFLFTNSTSECKNQDNEVFVHLFVYGLPMPKCFQKNNWKRKIRFLYAMSKAILLK